MFSSEKTNTSLDSSLLHEFKSSFGTSWSLEGVPIFPGNVVRQHDSERKCVRAVQRSSLRGCVKYAQELRDVVRQLKAAVAYLKYIQSCSTP